MFVNPHGSTALYDAGLSRGPRRSSRVAIQKKALLIISDGQDNNSRYTYKELRNRVKEADVQIYSIGINGSGQRFPRRVLARGILEEMTRIDWGGRAFFPNAYNEPELVEICTRIALELRPSVFRRLLSDRHRQRNEMAQGAGKGESTARGLAGCRSRIETGIHLLRSSKSFRGATADCPSVSCLRQTV